MQLNILTAVDENFDITLLGNMIDSIKNCEVPESLKVDVYVGHTKTVSIPTCDNVHEIELTSAPGRFEFVKKITKLLSNSQDENTTYYLFIDADDLIDKQYFVELNKKLEIEKPTAVITKAVRATKTEEGLKVSERSYLVLRPQFDDAQFIRMTRIWGIAWRADLFAVVAEYLLLPNTAGYGEENPLLFALLSVAKRKGLVSMCSTAVYYYMYGNNPNTLSRKIDIPSAIRHIELASSYSPGSLQSSVEFRLTMLLSKSLYSQDRFRDFGQLDELIKRVIFRNPRPAIDDEFERFIYDLWLEIRSSDIRFENYGIVKEYLV